MPVVRRRRRRIGLSDRGEQAAAVAAVRYLLRPDRLGPWIRRRLDLRRPDWRREGFDDRSEDRVHAARRPGFAGWLASRRFRRSENLAPRLASRRLLQPGLSWLCDVEADARIGDQRCEFFQRAYLVGHDAPHRLGCVARFLRQFEGATLQLLTRRLEIVLNLGRHLLHLVDRLAEPFGGVIENARELRVCLLDRRLQALRRALALLRGRIADRLELAGHGDGRALGRGGKRSGDFLRAGLSSSETLLDIGGEARKHAVECLAASGEFVDESVKSVPPTIEAGVQRLSLLREYLRDGRQRISLLR